VASAAVVSIHRHHGELAAAAANFAVECSYFIKLNSHDGARARAQKTTWWLTPGSAGGAFI